jgi:hypothetical protein
MLVHLDDGPAHRYGRFLFLSRKKDGFDDLLA